MAMEELIRTISRYTGGEHVGLRAHRVVILSAHRGNEHLEAVGKLRGVADLTSRSCLTQRIAASGCRGSPQIAFSGRGCVG